MPYNKTDVVRCSVCRGAGTLRLLDSEGDADVEDCGECAGTGWEECTPASPEEQLLESFEETTVVCRDCSGEGCTFTVVRQGMEVAVRPCETCQGEGIIR